MVKAQGVALSSELAELVYDVDYYVHVDTKEDAVKLVTHMPYAGHMLTTEVLNAYAGPVVEQAVNQLVQVTPLEQVNEKIHDITELVRGHLQDFLSIYGIMLNDVKVLVRPQRRADAGADLAAGVRAVGARRGALLRGDEDGGARAGLRAEHGGRAAVQHRADRGLPTTVPGPNGTVTQVVPGQ